MPVESILSRDAFLLTLELRLFWAAAFVYALSIVLHLAHIISGKTGAGKAGHLTLAASFSIHTLVIALRAFETGRVPFAGLYESLSFFAWSTAGTYIFVHGRFFKETFLPGLFISVVVAGACLYALFTGTPTLVPLSPPQEGPWFVWRSVFAFLSYAVITVSASAEAASLLKRRTPVGLYPPDTFRIKAHSLAIFAFPFLTLALFAQALWANYALGRYWSWQPFEAWSLMAWLVFALYLHARTTNRLGGPAASVLNIAGLACVLMALFVADLLSRLLGITGPHA